VTRWRIEFLTASWDEPGDTYIDVTWQASTDDAYTPGVDYPPIEALTSEEAIERFLRRLTAWRQRWYEEEGSLIARPERVSGTIVESSIVRVQEDEPAWSA
jgi:hypothetical protein